MEMYPDKTHVYTTKYLRNSKAVGLLWGVFTICVAIINVSVFIHPHWIGASQNSGTTAHFGLWQRCITTSEEGMECSGRLDDFESIISVPFKVATLLVAVAAALTITCVCALLLAFKSAGLLFHVGGWLHLLSALLLLASVLVYPAGFSAPEVRDVCGKGARLFVLGDCGLRWAYILAAIGVFDSAVLAVLAFVLGTKVLDGTPSEVDPMYGESMYKSHVNSGFIQDGVSVAGSRKSLNLQPVMLLPQVAEPDRFSEFSRSKTPACRTQYVSSMQNFQL